MDDRLHLLAVDIAAIGDEALGEERSEALIRTPSPKNFDVALRAPSTLMRRSLDARPRGSIAALLVDRTCRSRARFERGEALLLLAG